MIPRSKEDCAGSFVSKGVLMKEKLSYREVVRLLLAGGYTHREIAAASGCANSTVSNIKRRLAASGLDGPTALAMSEAELRGVLTTKQGRGAAAEIKEPDFAKVDEELARNRKLTLAILWEEYAEECRRDGMRPCLYSSFTARYRKWRNVSVPSLRISHVPADKMEVDWAGDTMRIADPFTGEETKVYLFVATLPYSQYTFVWPTLSMDMPAWIDANVRALRFFGGVPRVIVFDNCRTAVTKHTADEVVLNKTYQELGEFYGTALLPAGVRKPKEKASVEGSVGRIGERIALMLRNRAFADLADLRSAVAEKLDELNSRPFQRRGGGSRREAWESADRGRLMPLPESDFELARWEERTVSPDYRVLVDGVTYSVPYQFVRQKVRAKLTQTAVEVYCDGERIAVHPRSYAKGDDVKKESRQSKWHTEFLEQSAEWFRTRALEEIGPAARRVADCLLSAGSTEREGYRPCAKLLALTESYAPEQVEEACRRALDIARVPSLKSVKTLLRSQAKRDEAADAMADYTILRDEDYYAADRKGDAERASSRR